MAAIIPYTILAQGIYSGIIGTISTVTIGTCSAVKSIYTHKNPNVDNIIKELDIERKLKLIESVINAKQINTKHDFVKLKLNELEKTQIFEIVKGPNDKYEDPIELCLNYLHLIIQEIHTNLKEINTKVEKHKAKWFSSWRTLNIKVYLETLKANTKILDSRFDDLMKISQFLQNRNLKIK